MRKRRTHGVERALHVDVDHLVQVLRAQIEEPPVRADARIGDDDVEATMLLDDRGDESVDLARIAHVALPRDRVLDPEIVAAARGEAELDVGGGELPCDRRADPTTRAGDQRDLPFELRHVASNGRSAG